MKAAETGQIYRLTSTQAGAVGEAVAATGLMLASGGRLSPYRPVADDDGVDLLLVDKASRSIVQLQVKARMKVDDAKAETVQFDVQLGTFAEGARGYVLGILLDGSALRRAWLVPLAELRSVARSSSGKLVVVASTKEQSNDRFRRFRHDGFESIARTILSDDVARAAAPA